MNRNSRNKGTHKLLIAVRTIAVAIFLVFLLKWPVQQALLYFTEGTFWLKQIFNMGFTKAEHAFIGDDLSRCKKQNQQYRKNLEDYRFKLNALQGEILALEEAENLLKLRKSVFPKSIPVNIIGRSPNSWHREVIIDAGSADGIRRGMIAVSPNGLAGQVQEVKEHHSILELLSSAKLRFGATILRSKVKGILFGSSNSGYANLKFVPIGSDVQKGDIVLTSELQIDGLEQIYPLAYPVGQIVELGNAQNNAGMFIRVKLFENMQTASILLVLDPAGNGKSLRSVVPELLKGSKVPTSFLADASSVPNKSSKEKQNGKTKPTNAKEQDPQPKPSLEKPTSDNPAESKPKPPTETTPSETIKTIPQPKTTEKPNNTRTATTDNPSPEKPEQPDSTN